MNLLGNLCEKTVWIVIPTWNRCEALIDCLDSLSRITYKPFTILVVDNASTDNTVDSVKKLYPNVKIIRLSKNLGAPKASNIGFEHALDHGAEYVLRLDSDTIVSPGFLEPLVNKAEEESTIGVVSPKIYYHDPPDVIWYAGVDAHPWHFGSVNDQCNKKDTEIRDQSRFVEYVWAAAMLIKREVLNKTQGFDPDFFIYYEEVDFCLRVKDLGYQLYYVAESTIFHKVGTQNPSAWSGYYWNLSKMILFRKHARNKTHFILLVLYVILYALVDALLNKISIRKSSRNRGPLMSSLHGLKDGLSRKKLS
jgi:GT2 family glycosyltransferase